MRNSKYENWVDSKQPHEQKKIRVKEDTDSLDIDEHCDIFDCLLK